MTSSRKISQAVILSAGLGTRLRPLTDGIPKVMVSLLGKPLLLYQIEQLKKHGINDIFINLHYLPKTITDYFGDGSKFGVRITYVLETPQILGTAGGVKNFENKIKENFFVIYGDIFSEVDYTKMAEEFLSKRDPIGMEIIGKTDHPADSDFVEVDAFQRFKKIHFKPHREIPVNCQAMLALFVFNKKVFQYIPSGMYAEIDHEIIPRMLEAGENIYGYETDDYLADMGTLERYDKVKAYLEKKSI